MQGFFRPLVVRQPKIALVEVGRGAGEQGSRGEIYTSSFPPAPPHLCPSACHHAKFPWKTTSGEVENLTSGLLFSSVKSSLLSVPAPEGLYETLGTANDSIQIHS